MANAGLKQEENHKQLKKPDNQKNKTNRSHKTIKADFLATVSVLTTSVGVACAVYVKL